LCGQRDEVRKNNGSIPINTGAFAHFRREETRPKTVFHNYEALGNQSDACANQQWHKMHSSFKHFRKTLILSMMQSALDTVLCLPLQRTLFFVKPLKEHYSLMVPEFLYFQAAFSIYIR
jgi:hypothetical protein